MTICEVSPCANFFIVTLSEPVWNLISVIELLVSGITWQGRILSHILQLCIF